MVAGGLNTATGFICIALHCICEAKLQQDRTCPNMSKRAATRGSGILGCCAARLFRLTGGSRTTSFFCDSIDLPNHCLHQSTLFTAHKQSTFTSVLSIAARNAESYIEDGSLVCSLNIQEISCRTSRITCSGLFCQITPQTVSGYVEMLALILRHWRYVRTILGMSWLT